nr:ribonuclease H-like domain-containing protein [Tanacetum cinerariifolium]
IISQLAILGENISQKDLNMKFLRSLPSEWNTHVVVWRNKADLDIISLDDLYNNFKIVEQEVKRTITSSSSSGSQNMAFLSSSGSTNKVDTASIQVSAASTPVSTVSSHGNIANLSDATVYFQRTAKKITINGSDTAGYDKTKVECFNCHKIGYFARECRSPKNQESRPRNQDSSRKTVNVEDTSSKAMVAIDGAGFDWSYMADDEVPINIALMAFLDSEMVQKPVLKSVEKGTVQREVRPVWNNAMRTNHQNFSNSRRNFAPTAVLIKSGIVPISTARQSSSRAAAPVSATRPINTAASKPLVNVANPRQKALQTSHSLSRRPFYQQTALKNKILNNNVNIAKANSVNTAKGNKVTSAVGNQRINAVKSSTCWVWRPKIKVQDHGAPQDALKDQGYLDSGCSKHITGNISYFTDFKEHDGGYVAFGEGAKGGIRREYNVARTPQQNRVAERRNKILIEAARTIQYKDVKTLFEAIQARFGGTDATKKTQRTLLNTNKVDTASIQVSVASTPVSTVSSHDNIANLSDATMYFQRTAKKITINGSNTASFDKTKVECFNCHKMGYFARKCKSPKNQESMPRNQDSSRKTVNVEDTSSKAMVAINGVGFDWSYTADDEVPINMALMAFLDSEEFQHPEFKGYGPKDKKGTVQREVRPVWNNAMRTNHQNFSNSRRNFVPTAVLIKSGIVPISTARQSSSRAAAPVSATRPINTAASKPLVNVAKPRQKALQTSHSLSRRPFYQQTALKNKNLNNNVNIAKANSVNTAKGNKVTSAVGNQRINAVKSSTCWGAPQDALKDQGYLDSGCSRHITGNISHLTEFKEHDGGYVAFGEGTKGGIRREYNVARTPQQNRVAERRNKTLIEAAKTMLADSKLPTTFWAEAVNTACYVQNRVLVVKPHFKTLYELFKGRSPALSFMRPFGCHVIILNTLDQLRKFDGKSDEGIFVGYSTTSKAFRVYNIRTKKVEENLHITFLKNKPMIVGGGPKWLFDIDALSKSMNYAP